MKVIDLYYQVKPVIPRGLQISIRRGIASQKRRLVKDRWPIDPNSAQPPPGWKGWPDGKDFALVLYHDVDSLKGLKRCLRLMDVDRSMGFRSSFNFVPEDYPTPSRIVRTMSEAGFEVGVRYMLLDVDFNSFSFTVGYNFML